MGYSGYKDKDSLDILNKYENIKSKSLLAEQFAGEFGMQDTSIAANNNDDENLIWWLIQIVDPTGLTNYPDLIESINRLQSAARGKSQESVPILSLLTALNFFCAMPNFGYLAALIGGVPWAGAKVSAKSASKLILKALEDPKVLPEVAAIINKEILPYFKKFTGEQIDAAFAAALKEKPLPEAGYGVIYAFKEAIKAQDITKTSLWGNVTGSVRVKAAEIVNDPSKQKLREVIKFAASPENQSVKTVLKKAEETFGPGLSKTLTLGATQKAIIPTGAQNAAKGGSMETIGRNVLGLTRNATQTAQYGARAKQQELENVKGAAGLEGALLKTAAGAAGYKPMSQKDYIERSNKRKQDLQRLKR